MDAFSKLGIDLTSIIFYLVNTGILVFVLAKILYKPIIGFLEERKQVIAGSIQEAESLKKEFMEKQVAMNSAQEESKHQLKQQVEKMKVLVAKTKADLIAEIEEERTRRLEELEIELENHRQKLLQDSKTALAEGVQKLILHVLQNKVPSAIVSESVNEGWEKFIAK